MGIKEKLEALRNGGAKKSDNNTISTNNSSASVSNEGIKNKLNALRANDFRSKLSGWQTKTRDYFSGSSRDSVFEAELEREKESLTEEWSQNKSGWGASLTDFDFDEQISFFDRYKAIDIAPQWQSKYETLFTDADNLLKEANHRFSGKTSRNSVVDSVASKLDTTFAKTTPYRSDTAEWYSSVNDKKKALDTELAELQSQFAKYGKYWTDEKSQGEIAASLTDVSKSYSGVADLAFSDNEYWSQWDNEEDYNKAIKEQNKQSFLFNLSDNLKNYPDADKYITIGKNEADKKAVESMTESDKDAYYYLVGKSAEATYNHLKNGGSIKEPSAEVRNYVDLAESYSRLYPQIRVNKLLGENTDNVHNTEEYLIGEAYFDALENTYFNSYNISALSDDNKDMMKYLAGKKLKEKGYDSFTARGIEESEYLAQLPDSADWNDINLYLSTIEGERNKRKAEAEYEKIHDKPILEVLTSLREGIISNPRGIWRSVNFGNNDTEFTSGEYLQQMINEDLADEGARLPELLGGRSFWQAGSELAQSLGQMLPSMALSAIPYVGGALSSVSFGMSAGGNAKVDLMREGYDEVTATTYGVLVGVAEAGLEKLMGSIPGLGSTARKSLTSGIKSAVLRAVADVGVGMGLEATEESLQTILEPVFRYMSGVSPEDIEAPKISEIIYSGLQGAAMAGPMNIVSAVSENANTQRTGRAVKGSSAAVEQLKNLGSVMSAESVAYKLAGKIDENSSAYQIGRAFYEIGAELSEQEISTLTDKLTDKGMAKADATVLVEALQATMQGAELTDAQRLALENNTVLTETVQDLYSKAQNYNEITRLANEAVRVAEAEKTIKKGTRAVDAQSRVVAKAENALIKKYADLAEVKAQAETEGSTQSFAETLTADARYTTDEDFKALADEYIGAKGKAGKAQFALEFNKAVVETAKTNLKTEAEQKDIRKAENIKVREAKAKAKADSAGFNVSKDGRTQLVSTGENVSVQRVLDNGMLSVKHEDGTVSQVSMEEVAFENDNMATAYAVISDMAVPSQYMTNLTRNLMLNSDVSVGAQAEAMAEAFGYGEIGLSVDKVKALGVSDVLTEGQLKFAVELGQQNSTRNTQRAEREVQAKKEKALEDMRAELKYNRAKGKKGSFKHDFSKADIAAMKKQNPEKYNNFKHAEGISQLLAVDIQLIDTSNTKYQSYKNIGADGAYINGTVYLDINANWRGNENTFLEVLSHELTHYIRDWSPAKFKVLADFVVNEFNDNNVNVEALIDAQLLELSKLDAYKDKTASELRDIAFEEVVARACERMLVDSNAVQKLAELKQRDSSLFNRIKSFIQRFIKDIKSRFAEMNPHSEEAKAVKNIVGMTEKLAKLFEDAVVTATENQRIAGEQKNTADNSGVKFSLNKNAKTELHKAVYSTGYRDDVLLRDDTPSLMLSQKGVKNLKMVMKSSHIRENVLTEEEARNLGLRVDKHTHYHGLGEDFFLQIIDGLDDVKEAYRGTKNADNPMRREGYFLLVSQFSDETGNIINVPVYVNETAQCNRVFIDSNKIATVFGRNDFRDYIAREIKNGNLVRIKNKSSISSERNALIAKGYRNTASNNSISEPDKNVNGKFHLKSTKNMSLEELNSHYMSAVESGDMESAQRYVDEAAKRAGYTIKAYHGTNTGKFTVFDKAKGNVEGDFGAGFYLTSSEDDVSRNYEGGGPDFDNKVSRFAEKLQVEEDIEDYEEAETEARKRMTGGAYLIEGYVKIDNPAYADETYLFEDITSDISEEDYDSEEEYYEALDEATEEVLYDVMYAVNNLGYWGTEDVAMVLSDAVMNGGMLVSDLKDEIGRLEITDDDGNWASSEVVRTIIETLGYDGIIDRTVSEKFKNMNLESDTTHYIVFGSEQIKSADPVTYDDAGNVIPLSERFNEKKPDIRWHRKSLDALSDSELLARHLEENSEAVGEILSRTADIEINPRVLNLLVNRKLKEYGISKEGRESVADVVPLLLDSAKIAAVKGGDITADLTSAIADAVRNTDYTENLHEEDRAEVVEALKGFKGRVYLNEGQAQHLLNNGYTFQSFRQSLFGKLNVVRESANSKTSETPFSEVYLHLSEQFPNLFVTRDSMYSEKSVDESEYALDLIEKLDSLSEEHQMRIEDVFGADANEVATHIMSELVADVVQKKYSSRKNPYVADVVEKLRAQRDRAVKKERQRAADKRKTDKSKIKERYEKRETEIKEKNAERREKAKESHAKTEMRHKIIKSADELTKLLLKGTKDKNVKAGLQATVADALISVNENMDTVGAEKRLAKIKAEIDKATDPAEKAKLMEKYLNISNMGFKTEQRLSALKDAYEEIKHSDDQNLKNAYYDFIYDRIGEVKKKVGNTSLRDMTMDQLEALDDLYTLVLDTIKYNDKVWKQGKREDVANLATTIYKEVQKTKKLKNERSAISEKTASARWSLLKPFYAFENVGSDTFNSLFWEVQRGEEIYARDCEEARSFLAEQRKKYGWQSWDRIKTDDFVIWNGKTMSLNLGQKLDIYNAVKRKQYIKHIENGGYIYESSDSFRKTKDGKKSILKYVHTANDSYRLSEIDIANIVSTLTEEQKAYADKLEEYLTKTMGGKGNEASKKLWGIELFKEKHYTPIQTAKEYVHAQNVPVGEVQLKNMGSAKATVPNAQNPIVLRNYEDRWVEHTVQMSLYHALVVPIDSLNKTLNYSQYINNDINNDSWSVETIIGAAHGKAAADYFRNWVKDLNGGVTGGKRYSNIAMKLFGNSKKVAVAVSGSTIVQQGTAVIRGMAIINPKYFTMRADGSVVNHFESIKKYAPIAIIKEMGGFDVGSNRSAVSYIGDYKAGKNALKAFATDKDYRQQRFDNAIMKGASFADEVGWSFIWDAVINEQQEKLGVKLKNLNDSAKEKFLQKCGQRFTEVIVKTQVYDSVTSRSAMMRSDRDLDKFMTAFMGEPTTSLNMLHSALVQGKRGNVSKAQSARTIGAVYASIIMASAFASLVYAMRDDEEDKSFMEKWAYQFGSKLRSELNPVSMIPWARDVLTIFQGWKVSRPDMDIVQDIYDSLQTVKDDDKSAWDKVQSVSSAIASAFGIPLKNVLRDGKAIYNFAENVFDDTTADVGDIKNSFVRGISGKKQDMTATEIAEKLYEAKVSGNTAEAEELRKTYKDPSSYHSAIKKMLRANDPRIREAAQADVDGNIRERARLSNEIVAEGHFEQIDILDAIDSEAKAIRKESEPETSTEWELSESFEGSYYKTDDIHSAFEDGDNKLAVEIIDDIISSKTANGVREGKTQEQAEKDARSSVQSAFTEHWKAKYVEACNTNDEAEKSRIRSIVEASGLYENTDKTIKGWTH